MEKSGRNDRQVPAIMKGKLYKMVVRPCLETVALMNRHDAIELKMLTFALGVKRMYRIRNTFY